VCDGDGAGHGAGEWGVGGRERGKKRKVIGYECRAEHQGPSIRAPHIQNLIISRFLDD
jgi:hypothetical protein